jgi:D-alanine-D-alanine ligase
MRIAVLLGGFSSEREVSLRSGAAVAKALRERGHEVCEVDVRDERVAGLDGARPDVAFIALHGAFGEDGGVQALLESKGIPYTGSGPAASRRAMDKVEAKDRFLAAGVPVAPHITVRRDEGERGVLERILAFGMPVVVKPRAEGSSVGVTIHKVPDALDRGLAEAFRYHPEALVERFIAGRELTVGILEDRALPVVEMKPAREFFDYEAKYQDDRTVYIVDPPLGAAERERVQAAARDAHRALGCEGFSRVDLILTAAGEPCMLEVNTVPGLTERSLLPKAARAAGIEFPELCERIVRDGRGRQRRGGTAAGRR